MRGPLNSAVPDLARLAFWITFIVWVLIQMWIGRRDQHPSTDDMRDRGSRIGIFTGITIGALAASYISKLFGGHPLGAEGVLVPGGLAVAWAGLALHLWSVKTLGRFFRTIVILDPEHQLITSGPYRLLRHPSYSSAMVTLIGLGLILNNWIGFILVVLIPLPGFLWRIRVEEQALYEQFGKEFLDYRRKRWALLPLLW
jgi:protein-S-isoprenylcysteine O-methyltransferase